LLRQWAVWLAVFALYMQLGAAALCSACFPVAADANTGLFPICHAQSDAGSPGQAQNDHAPAQHQGCPFCAVHCHAAMVITPSLANLDSLYAVTKPAAPAPFIAAPVARFSAGAPPRGPPASI
jgi:hypothetical protein